jgi:hypothetical protein
MHSFCGVMKFSLTIICGKIGLKFIPPLPTAFISWLRTKQGGIGLVPALAGGGTGIASIWIACGSRTTKSRMKLFYN